MIFDSLFLVPTACVLKLVVFWFKTTQFIVLISQHYWTALSCGVWKAAVQDWGRVTCESWVCWITLRGGWKASFPSFFFVCFCFLEEGRGGNMARRQVCGKYQEANGGKLHFGWNAKCRKQFLSLLTLHAFGTYVCNGQDCVLTKYPRVSCRIHISDVLCWWFGDVFPLKAHRALCVCDQAVEMSGLITLLCSQVNKCIS